jgi:hypothetical protein
MGQALGAAGTTAGPTPPPLPKETAFFAVLDGKQAGPFSPPQLQEQVTAGKVSRDTLVWQEGMTQWTAAGKVPALTSLFASVPPPVPQG